jgi:gamma-glutamyltranspeptidase / glutathione hydrolase
MDLQTAMEAPRFATYSIPSSSEPRTYLPGRLTMDNRLPKTTGNALKAMGHDVTWWPTLAEASGACVRLGLILKPVYWKAARTHDGSRTR